MNKQSGIMGRSLGMGLMALATAIVAAGCAVDTGEHGSEPLIEGQPLESVAPDGYFTAPENKGTGEKACGAWRPDWVKAGYDTVMLATGNFGAFAPCISWCPGGSYAYGVQLVSEWAQGGGDDTAVNAIRVNCYDRWTGAYTGTITSDTMPWGTGGTTVVAPTVERPIVGGKSKFQPNAGTAIDDAQLTAAQFRLKDGTWIAPSPSNVVWGSWLAEDAQCQAGSAVCGIQTRVEPMQGSDEDDTALTGAQLYCCSFPNSP